MFADPDGCTCCDETTRRCEVHNPIPTSLSTAAAALDSDFAPSFRFETPRSSKRSEARFRNELQAATRLPSHEIAVAVAKLANQHELRDQRIRVLTNIISEGLIEKINPTSILNMWLNAGDNRKILLSNIYAAVESAVVKINVE
jgi:hypothetical protein